MFNFVSNEEKMKNKEAFINDFVLKSFRPYKETEGDTNIMEFLQLESYEKEKRVWGEKVFRLWKELGLLNSNNEFDKEAIRNYPSKELPYMPIKQVVLEG